MLIGRVQSVSRYPVKSLGGESLASTEVALDGLLGDRAFAVRDDDAGEIRSARKWPRLMAGRAHYPSEPTPSKVPAALITLPDGRQLSTDDPQVSQQLSSWLGARATLFPRLPASNKEHYRRAHPGATAAGLLARSSRLRKVVAKLANVGPGGDELRREFGREPGEDMPDLSVLPGFVFEYASQPGTYFDAYPIHLLTTASLASFRAKNPGGDWDARRFRPNFLIETNPSLTGFAEFAWAGRALRIGEVELECTVAVPRCSMVTQAQPDLPKDTTVLRTIVRESDHKVGIYASVRRIGRVAVGDAVELLDA